MNVGAVRVDDLPVIDTDVLVVGAGPTGLMAGVVLSRRGVPAVVVDRKAGPTRESRALAVQARTMEIYDQLGLAETVLAGAFPAMRVRIGESASSEGPDFSLLQKGATRFPGIQIFEQSRNEQLLADTLNAAQGDIRWQHRLVDLIDKTAQPDGRVEALIEGEDGSLLRVRARWCIGADGAASAVRRELNLPFDGKTDDATFWVADVRDVRGVPEGTLNIRFGQSTFAMAFPLGPGGHTRLLALAAQDAITQDEALATADAEFGLTHGAVDWFSTYRVHHRVASKRVFENSRWAGVCLAEKRRSRLLVGSVITKSPPRPGAHNAIIADLAMPVVPAPRGGRTWLRGVLVVGDRRRVGDPRTAVARAGQHGRPRRTTREALPPCDSGRHPVYRARCYRVAATAGGVPASRDGVPGVARWARSAAWQRILETLRDRLRVRAGRDRCPTAAIIDSQTVPAADTVPRSSRGCDGAKRTNGVKRHIAVDVNGLLLGVVVTAASIQDRDAAHRLLAALRGSFSTIALVWADGGYPGRLLIWAKDVLTLTMQIIKRIPGAAGFHVRPRIWVVERSFAWINKHRRCVRDYETRPDHHEAMAHLAMITTMTRRLART